MKVFVALGNNLTGFEIIGVSKTEDGINKLADNYKKLYKDLFAFVQVREFELID